LDSIRLDKWLWAARFFKTRQLAQEAVNGGKVELNGQRSKPAHPVRAGDRLRVRQGLYVREIVIQALSDRRGPAAAAWQLYAETESSRARNAQLRETLKAEGATLLFESGRPKARDRRSLRQLRRTASGDGVL
jgi:ribosome-associated heat shock protein Hsp15